MIYASNTIATWRIHVQVQCAAADRCASISYVKLLIHYCRFIWVCIPLCLLGVLLTAQPNVLFGGSPSSHSISRTGIAVGLCQVKLATMGRPPPPSTPATPHHIGLGHSG